MGASMNTKSSCEGAGTVPGPITTSVTLYTKDPTKYRLRRKDAVQTIFSYFEKLIINSHGKKHDSKSLWCESRKPVKIIVQSKSLDLFRRLCPILSKI